ncbi:hypothetical protein KR222_011698, partial [Zaprionus bogoriensis]
WWNWRQTLPSRYSICDAELNFNLDGCKPMRTIQKSMHLSTPLIVPKLKRVRLCVKPKPVEPVVKETTPPLQWEQVHSVQKPPSPVPVDELDLLPTSADLWNSYEATKQGAKPQWPLCCLQNVGGSVAVPVAIAAAAPPARTVDSAKSLPPSPCYTEQLDKAVAWLLDYQSEPQQMQRKEVETDQGTIPDESSNITPMELDTLQISLDEERGLLDCLKAKRLHTPLSDIKAYDTLQSLVRSEENRKALHDLLKSKLIGQRKAEEQAKSLPKAQIGVEETSTTAQDIAQETTINAKPSEDSPAESVLPLETTAPVIISNEIIIQQDKDSPAETALDNSIAEESKEAPQTKTEVSDQPVIISMETLPASSPVPVVLEEEAVQRWLQQMGQHLSSVVQSRIEAMPKQAAPSTITITPAGPIDFEAEISLLPAKANAAERPQSAADPASGATGQRVTISTSSSWEGSYKQRLEDFDHVIDQKWTEFRDPLEKRMRGRAININTNSSSNDAVFTRNLESLKRFLLMPALPSHLDQGLQQIRILRPPTKRKIERAKLPIEMKTVRLYSTTQTNLKLQLNQLATELDNAVYNSDIQVLQKRYEAAQIAWIWDNGSVLISNARNSAILAETQQSLVSKIRELTHTPAGVNEQSAQQESQMMTVTQFPWHICIEEFCQSYALSTETVQGTFRYAYYVNKSIAGVAAKVYESGAIQVLAMSPAEADKMLEKLYLLTANHRKTKSLSMPLSQGKLNHNGAFASLFPP